MVTAREQIEKSRFAFLLYVVFSLFFASFAVYSAATYSSVVEAQTLVVLEDTVFSMEELANGSVRFTFFARMVNPSGFDLHVYSTSWSVFVENGTFTNPNVFLLNEFWGSYTGTTLEIPIAAGGSQDFVYERIVSNRALLTRLWGFINYSAAHGLEYDVETVPYVCAFEVIAWIGDFTHDYERARYLNDLVRVDLEYRSVWGVA